MEFIKYEPRNFSHLKGLTGISDQVLADHFKLYEGYVTNTNKLNGELATLIKDGKAAGTNPAFAEISRRLGFEYNGMILHEYYFDNLKAGGTELDPNGALGKAMAASYGSVEAWLADFKGIATMRGIGWACCSQDPITKRLRNHWIQLHEDGNLAGYKVILIMDAWEHAFVPDYKPFERAKYVDAYFKNVDYKAAEARLIG